MASVIHRSFGINLQLMRALRFYPPKPVTRLYKVQAHLMYLLFVLPVPILSILYLLLEENVNKERLNYNAGFLAQTTCFTTKLLPFIINSHRIRRCIDYFGASSFSVRTEYKPIMDNCVEVCRKNTLFFLMCVVAGGASWATRPLFWKDRNFPVDIWLPFNSKENIFVFLCIYLFVVVGVFFTTLGSGVIDPLIAGLAYHATTQIRILKIDLQTLSEHAKAICEKDAACVMSQVIYIKITEAIKHHNLILRFAKEYEECFSYVVFSQFAGSVFVICFTCMQLSKIESLGYYFFQLIMYFNIILAQIYFYCYYGSTLFEESNTLISAIYTSQWYTYDIVAKKALISLMERCKKPIIITAGKVLTLSLTTFAVILRRSYSLVAVLKNYQ